MPAAIIEPLEKNSTDFDEASKLTNGHSEMKPAVKYHMPMTISTSYPSQALRFLQRTEAPEKNLKDTQDSSSLPLQARFKLNVIVVGAGLGGLSVAIALTRRGHSVQVLEQAPSLGEVGAGIQIPPNSGRLLKRWGVFEYLDKWAVKPDVINFRRWQSGKVIGHTPLGAAFQEDFEVPYYVVHRAHFHEALHQRALEMGVVVKLGSRVVEYDESSATVVLQSGVVVRGDLVVAADGIKSRAREILHPNISHEAKYNGFAAYRATVDAKKIIQDKDIAWMLQKPSLNIWIGENRHVMSYTIAAGDRFNMVLSHVDHSDPETWTAKFAKEDILKEFSGWDPQLVIAYKHTDSVNKLPRLIKVISLIDDCMKWPLKVGSHLPSWTSKSSKLVILGDAAHAMLPYMSQGAAMAVEDGAALAVALNRISSIDEIPFALRVFQGERMKRSGDMQEASAVNGIIWHFPDGSEQLARDKSMAAEVTGLPFTNSANQWSDPVTRWWAFGYDAENEMESAWDRAVSELILKLDDDKSRL